MGEVDVASLTADPDRWLCGEGTNSLTVPLLGREVPNRLAAMFSLPFVVATAWAHGEVTPAVMDPTSEAFARSRALLGRVSIEVDDSLDLWLPRRRVTEVTLADGTTEIALASPNPVGDANHFPLGPTDVRLKLNRLVGAHDARRVVDVASRIADCDDVAGLLAGLP